MLNANREKVTHYDRMKLFSLCISSIIKLVCALISVFRQVLEDMEMLSAFTAVLHVPNLSQPDHLMAVLEESDVFNKSSLSSISRKIRGHRYVIVKTQLKHNIKPYSQICTE